VTAAGTPDGGPSAARHQVTDARVVAIRGERALELPEVVVTEEPLEVRAAGPGQEPALVGVTMRTPGHDFELAVGFLLSEGVVADPDTVRSVRYCELSPGQDQDYNVVTVRVADPVDLQGRQRRFVVNASCGVCGTADLQRLEAAAFDLHGPLMARSAVLALPDRLRPAQRVFDRTGGLHAAGLFDADGGLLAVREDVGRHNAVDKLVGWAALDHRLPLSGTALAVSGRVSFEIVQKAALAGIGFLVAVSAPSSLAVEAARRAGMTLVAFVRGGRANIYAGAERVDLSR
jgi:FdhD protein